MKEKLIAAITFALQNNISEMSCTMNDVLKDKIKDKMSEKKKKVAEDLMGISGNFNEDDAMHTHTVHFSCPQTGEWKGKMLINAEHDKEAVDSAHKMAKKHGLKVFKVSKNNSVMLDKTIGEEIVYEDAEDLEEISKATLGSYIRKASHESKVAHGVSKNSKNKKISSSLSDLSHKRDKGIDKAVHKLTKEESEDLDEKHMTSAEKSKEKKLKAKYDPSEMKSKMIAQYGPDKGKSVYFATIRKQAMKEDEQIDESLSIMTIKKHYNELPADQFEKQYGHPKHVVASIFGW